MTALLALPLRTPRATLAVVAAVSLVLLPAALRVRVDSAVDRLLPSDDAARRHLDGVRATFGSDEIAVVALFADDVFAPPTLRRLAALTHALGALDDVREVRSLPTLERIQLGPDGLGRVRLIPPEPWTPAALARFKAAALAHPLGRGIVVGPEGRAAGIVVRFAPMTDAELLRRDLDGRLRAVVAAHPGPEPVAITGLPTLKVQAARAMLQDVRLFVPLAVLVVVIVLAFAFRNLRGVVLPLAAVLLGLEWTSALMALAGGAYTLATVVLPPLLLAVGIAYAIHLIARWEHERAAGGTPAEVGTRTLAHAGPPVAMAALTTLAGFATFVWNPIPSIRDFGWYAGFGITAILLATLTVVPAGLVLWPEAGGATGRWTDAFVRRVTDFALRRRAAVLAGTGAIAVLALLGVGRIRVETDYLRFFAPHHPARVENQRIADALAGMQLVDVTVDGTAPERATRLDVLRPLADLTAFLESRPGVDTTTSYLDHLAMLRDALEPETADRALADQRAVDQRLLLLDPAELRSTLSADHARARVTAFTHLSGSGEVTELVRQIDAFAADRFPADVTVRATGTLVLLTRSADALARGQTAGLRQVFVVLLLLMLALFRSVRLALLSLVPNVFPLVVLFGIMGWTGIDLNISTSMIACIAIGIAVDDTIHYMTAFEARRRIGADATAAVHATVAVVGRPVVVTSVALAAGFLVVCLSNFQPVRFFGVLASLTMVTALAADLLLLPALLSLVGRRPRA